MTLRRAFPAVLLAAFAGPALVACDGSTSPPEAEEGLGRIEVALSAMGPDGATYTLPADATLLLTPTSGALTAAIDSGAPSTLMFQQGLAKETFSVPAGQYVATLQGGNAQNQFELGRSGDGGAVGTLATLTDDQPYNVTVTVGATTALVFHFSLVLIGDVTFGTGSLVTSIEVSAADGGPASSGHELVHLRLGKTTGGSDPLSTLIGPDVGEDLGVDVEFSVSGPFVAGIDSACAPITTAGPVPGFGDALLAFFEEAFGGTGTLCLYDTNGYTLPLQLAATLSVADKYPNAAVLQFTRVGPPQTGAIADALADAGSDTFAFTDVIIGMPQPPLYDGTTASLSTLQNGVAFNVPLAFIQLDSFDAEFLTPDDPTLQGATLTLSP
jgi:hypothetical protein